MSRKPDYFDVFTNLTSLSCVSSSEKIPLAGTLYVTVSDATSSGIASIPQRLEEGVTCAVALHHELVTGLKIATRSKRYRQSFCKNRH
jgi:hypothetical protein